MKTINLNVIANCTNLQIEHKWFAHDIIDKGGGCLSLKTACDASTTEEVYPGPRSHYQLTPGSNVPFVNKVIKRW